jgi:hypothetical protein
MVMSKRDGREPVGLGLVCMGVRVSVGVRIRVRCGVRVRVSIVASC